MELKKIITKVAEELNLPFEVVKAAYYSDWEFRRKVIEELPLKEDLSEEEFRELRVNFNLPSLGKIHLTFERYLAVKEKFRYLTEFREKKNEENKESTSST